MLEVPDIDEISIQIIPDEFYVTKLEFTNH